MLFRSKTSAKNAQVGEKSAEAKETKKPASYSLDEHTQNDQVIIKMMETHQSVMIKVLDSIDSITNINQK